VTAGTVTGVLALAAVVLARGAAPGVFAHLGATPWGWAVQGGVGAVAVGSMVATVRRRDGLARVLVAGQLLGVLIGWVTALYPALLPPDLTVTTAAAPTGVLVSTLAVLGIGASALLPAFVWLYRVFKA
jgi:cytochrome d ubiquinol oxidase subunit II